MSHLGHMYAMGRGVDQDYQEAVYWLRQAADKQEPDAQASLAYLYVQGWGVAKDDRQAVKLYRQAAVNYFKRGFESYKSGEYKPAIHAFELTIKVDPGHWGAFFYRGNAYNFQGQYQAAIADYNKTIELKPDFAEAFQRRGLAFANLKKYDQAIEDFNRAIELKPKYAAAHTNRGYTWEQMGLYAKAIADYEQALSINPGNKSACNNLAWVLATCPIKSLRGGQRAIELALKAVILSEEKDSYAIGTLAAAFAENGQFIEAIIYQEKALAMVATENDAKRLRLYQRQLQFYQNRKPWRIAKHL